jgi:hypothetical protein
MSTLSTPHEIVDTDNNIHKSISNKPNAPNTCNITPIPIEGNAISRQIEMEKLVISRQEQEMKDNWEGLRLIGRGTSIKKAQSKIAEWYYPLAEMLELEKSLIHANEFGEDRSVIFYFLL